MGIGCITGPINKTKTVDQEEQCYHGFLVILEKYHYIQFIIHDVSNSYALYRYQYQRHIGVSDFIIMKATGVKVCMNVLGEA